MLKISSIKSAKPRKSKTGDGSDKKARRDGSKLNGSEMDDIEVDDGEIEDNAVEKKCRKTSKSKNPFKFKKMVESDFLTSKARLAFTKLRQAFIKAPILYQFDSKHHIRVETNASGYAIGGVLSQLTSDDSGQWHPLAFFSWKMIFTETRYETYDNELLAIVKAFKTWKHYLERS